MTNAVPRRPWHQVTGHGKRLLRHSKRPPRATTQIKPQIKPCAL